MKFTQLITLLLLSFCASASAGVRSYIIEDYNDEEFERFPPPPPVKEETSRFTVVGREHTEVISILSTNLRNLSVTIRNAGDGVIKRPYMTGSFGWDFRDQTALAASLTQNDGLTSFEKFVRVHEWEEMAVQRAEPAPGKSGRRGFVANPLRMLNQFGQCMCGEHVNVLNSVLRAIPDEKFRVAKIQLDGHQTSEVLIGGKWYASDASPTARWIYFQKDNATPATFAELKANPDLISRIAPYSGIDITDYVKTASLERKMEDYEFESPDFNYDLAPGESITMHFDMRGRFDDRNANFHRWPDPERAYRHWSDYGSAVFDYGPDLTPGGYRGCVVEEKNVTRTAGGLEPTDPSQDSRIVFAVDKAPWAIVGAEIEASFKTDGNVYIARKSDDKSAPYSPSVVWTRLDESRKEYDVPLEGEMNYWVKFEFKGKGSGLSSVRIRTEIQMNPRAMPGLMYGRNRIRFEAADMGGSSAEVTYRYDMESPYHFYEAATENYGRHIRFRVGGNTHTSYSKPASYRNAKGEFWRNLKRNPDGTLPITVEIFKASGEGTGKLIRTLKSENLRYGNYSFYWNGRDENGRIQPVGMYSVRILQGGHLGYQPVFGSRLYLFSKFWPIPNELR